MNKIDVVGWDRAVFNRIDGEYAAFARELGLRDVHYLPLSALRGDNVVASSENMPWYEGPPLLRLLETVPIHARASGTEALRLPVQYVIRPDLDFRGFAGTLASGAIRRGDRVMSLPSRRTSTVSRLVTRDGDLDEASAPMAVTVTLADEIDVSRGDMFVPEDRPPHVARSIEAMVVWMHETPPRPGATYLLKHTTRLVPAEVREIHERVDVTTLERGPASVLGLNEIGRVTLHAARPLLFDAYAESRATGAFILVDRLTNGTFGAGMILRPGAADVPGEEGGGGVTLAERERRLDQKAAVVALRAPSLAAALERALWDEGHTAHVLGPGELGALAVCQRLGMISIVLGDAPSVGDPASVVIAGREGATEASLLAALRERGVIRSA